MAPITSSARKSNRSKAGRRASFVRNRAQLGHFSNGCCRSIDRIDVLSAGRGWNGQGKYAEFGLVLSIDRIDVLSAGRGRNGQGKYAEFGLVLKNLLHQGSPYSFPPGRKAVHERSVAEDVDRARHTPARLGDHAASLPREQRSLGADC